MASIKDLRKSITQMSYESALLVIRQCRDSRRVAPPTKSKAKSKAKTQKRIINPFDLVKTMTDEQKARLRQELLGE